MQRVKCFVGSRRSVALSLLLQWACPAWADMAVEHIQAPDWSLPVWSAQGPTGKTATLSQYQGQWLYLDFWASWCGPCKQSFPWMLQLQNQLGKHGLQVVTIGLDKTAQPMEQFLRQYSGAELLVVWDPTGDTARRFEVKAMPSSYLVNPQGRIVWSHRGFQAASGEALKQKITNLIGAK